MRDTTARRLSTLHRVLYRGTRGVVGRRFVANDMLLLTTKGRVSGAPHTVPLLYLQEGPDLVVVASWGGRHYPPDWFVNLVAAPAVTMQVNGSTIPAAASVMEEPERTAWWERFVTAYQGYTEYQAKTERTIPIIRLVPTDDPGPSHRHHEETHGNT